MKKIIAVLLALVMMLGMVACSSGSNGNTDDAKATTAAENFMDAFMALDFETAKKYASDPEDIDELAEKFDYAAIMGELPEEAKEFADELESVYDLAMDKVKSCMSYKILSTEKKDDNYEVKAEITVPDADEDIAAALEAQLTEDILGKLLMDAISEGKISLNSSEEEMMAYLIPKILELVEDAVKNLELKTKTEETTLVVEQQDGRWLVNVGDSF